MPNNNHNLLVVATFLAICVISFVHVFLFPLYDVNPKTGVLKTVADYEQSLCLSNLRHAKSRRREACPRDGIVTVAQGGRLGNQMWEYADVWAVARHTGLDPYVPRCVRRRLDQVFERLSVPTLQAIAHCPVRWRAFVRSLDAWSLTNQSILLPRYTTLPDIVLAWASDLRQEFAFRQKLADVAQRVLEHAASQVAGDGHIFVGVHVRRTDYSSYLWRTRHTSLANPQYFYKAMRFFETKFEPPIIFIVVSDDPAWCVQHLSIKNNVFVVSRTGINSAGQDLAIMAACNHSIIDYGTYGIWGAILAGGETILYNVSQHSSLRVSELLPNWHVLQ